MARFDLGSSGGGSSGDSNTSGGQDDDPPQQEAPEPEPDPEPQPEPEPDPPDSPVDDTGPVATQPDGVESDTSSSGSSGGGEDETYVADEPEIIQKAAEAQQEQQQRETALEQQEPTQSSQEQAEAAQEAFDDSSGDDVEGQSEDFDPDEAAVIDRPEANERGERLGDFESDSILGQIEEGARDLAESGSEFGEETAEGIAGAAGIGGVGQQTVGEVGSAVGGAPGDIGTLGIEAAEASAFQTEPLTRGDVGESITRTGQVVQEAGLALGESADRNFDFERPRFERTEGGAITASEPVISVEEGRDANVAAGLTLGLASAGASASGVTASRIARGAGRATRRGTRTLADEFSGSGRERAQVNLAGGRRRDSSDGVEADGDQLMRTRERETTQTREPGELTEAERRAAEEMELDEQALREEFGDQPETDARTADPNQPGDVEQQFRDDFERSQQQAGDVSNSDLRSVSDVDATPSQVSRTRRGRSGTRFRSETQDLIDESTGRTADDFAQRQRMNDASLIGEAATGVGAVVGNDTATVADTTTAADTVATGVTDAAADTAGIGVGVTQQGPADTAAPPAFDTPRPTRTTQFDSPQTTQTTTFDSPTPSNIVEATVAEPPSRRRRRRPDVDLNFDASDDDAQFGGLGGDEQRFDFGERDLL